jgi:MFS family permease
LGQQGAAVRGMSPCSSYFAGSLALALGPSSVWVSCETSTFLRCSLVDFAAPVYISELAPPKLRGLFVTLTGVNLMIGQALASYMGLAFYSVGTNSSQWRGPMGVQLVFPLLSLVTIYWLPESPRWLLMKGKEDSARRVVVTLHGRDVAAQEFASAEFYQMSKQAEFDRALDSSWKACATRPSYRKRFEICCLYGAITQSTGLLVISAYGSVLYGTLGYGAREQILFQCGYITVAVVFNIIGKAPCMHF